MGAQGAGHGTGGAEDVAPGIVGIGDHGRSGGVQDGSDIALEVGGVVVSGAIVGDQPVTPVAIIVAVGLGGGGSA